MDSVFIVVRTCDVEGYRISGIFLKKEDADNALIKLNEDGYGMKDGNRVEKVPVNKYFDLGDIAL